jgi:hypothetical protein
MHMLAAGTGRGLSIDEYNDLLRAVGLRLTVVRRTGIPLVVIEAVRW